MGQLHLIPGSLYKIDNKMRQVSDMYNGQLDTFIQVAEAGSFSRAAQMLYISPTAVIKQVNLLESDLDLKLFNRTHKGIELTPEGKSLYQDAKYIVKYSKDSIERARKAGKAKKDIVRMGTSLMTPCQFLIDRWPKIETECPNIKLQLVSFENIPENAREILANMGKNIDVVAGIFDEDFSLRRGCATKELYRAPISIAVSINHPLAAKERLKMQDLFGMEIMFIHRGWNRYIDLLRDDLIREYPQIQIEEFSFYSVEIFNQCENSDRLLIAIDSWHHVHPLIKIIPVDWSYSIPFGLMFSPEPKSHIIEFIKTVSKVFSEEV